MTTPRDLSYISVIPPDGGWGWAVSVGVAWCNGAIFGVINNYSKIMVQIQHQFPQSSNSVTGGINSVLFGLTFALSPIAGILSDKIGIRKTCCLGSILACLGMFLSSFAQNIYHLMFTFGVVLGCGCSLVFSPSLVILGHYFDKRLGLVNGLVTLLGSSLFTCVMPHLLDVIFAHFSLAASFRILSCMHVVMFLFCLTFSTVQRPVHVSRGKKAWINRKVFKLPYLLWVVAISIGLSGYSVIYTFIVPFVQEETGEDYGGLMISLIGASAAVGRIIFGKVSDFSFINRVHLQQGSMAVFGLCYVILPNLSSYTIIAVMCCLFGLADGCFVTLMGPVSFDIVGNKGASQGLGYALLSMSIFMTSGPPTAGKIYDVTHSLKLPFYLAGGAAFIGSLVLCISPRRKKSRSDGENFTAEAEFAEALGERLANCTADSAEDLRTPSFLLPSPKTAQVELETRQLLTQEDLPDVTRTPSQYSPLRDTEKNSDSHQPEQQTSI